MNTLLQTNNNNTDDNDNNNDIIVVSKGMLEQIRNEKRKYDEINDFTELNNLSKKQKTECKIENEKLYSMTLKSNAGSVYTSTLTYITKIYIEQNKKINCLNLQVHNIDGKNEDEVKYRIPEEIEITIKYEGIDIICKNMKTSRDHGSPFGIVREHTLCLNCKSSDIIEKLIIKAYHDYNIYHDMTIHIYDVNANSWKRIGYVHKRKSETVIMDNNIKVDLLNDIDDFIKSKEDYEYFGQQYKRNYLFHGNPGTGKTSLVSVIATILKRNIYIINFSKEITDTALITSIANINNNDAILLLEDIDCVCRNRNEINASINFSTLLNILDGVNKPSGLITILTTNHIDKLDKALIRPGRIDKKIAFTTITNEQITKLLELYKIDISTNIINDLYKKSKSNNLTTSSLSEFLFRHRKCNTLNNDNILNYFVTYINEIIKPKKQLNMYT